jgi:5-deoxy-5-amino-3-dehydroquinate dehydratase
MVGKRILLINGPNLGRLGRRKPEIYGRTTLTEVEKQFTTTASRCGYATTCFQSNSEGAIIDFLEENLDAAGAVINPGALMMNGFALADALEAWPAPWIEIHISNIWAREKNRHHSVLARTASGIVVGLGTDGYDVALFALLRMIPTMAGSDLHDHT